MAQLVYKTSVTTASREAAGPLKILTANFGSTIHGYPISQLTGKEYQSPAQKIACNHGLISLPGIKFCFSSYLLMWNPKNLPYVSWTSEGKDIGMCMCIHLGTRVWCCKEETPVASATNLVMTKACQSILHCFFCL